MKIFLQIFPPWKGLKYSFCSAIASSRGFPMWCEVYICIQPCKLLEDPALHQNFVVQFGWALSSSYYHPPPSLSPPISIFPTFHTLAFFLLSFWFLSPSLASPCFSTLACLLLICFFFLTIKPGPNSSSCETVWQSSLKFVSILTFLLVGAAAKDAHQWESWPLEFW